EVLLGVLDALADRLGDLASLAQAGADHAVAVADHDHRAEAEAAAALHDLGDAVDLDDLLFQVELGWIDSSHGVPPLQVEAALAGTLGERANPPVVLVSAAVEDHGADAGGLRALRHGLAHRVGMAELAALAIVPRGACQR